MKMGTYTALRFILLIIGTGIFLWFLIPGFLTGNFNIGSWTGIGIGLVFIVYAALFFSVNRLIETIWSNIAGKLFIMLLLIIAAAIIAAAAACSICMISGASKLAGSNCTIIVLGAKIKDDKVSLTLARRLDAAYEYLMDNPDSACIVSGGQGSDEICTEASLMLEYLLDKGVDESRIYVEDRSTDTDENIRYSKEIIETNSLNRSVCLATDGYHEYRAISYAKANGIEAAAVPSSTTWWLFPTSIVREMYGILEMWILK